jgi:hypothetical protein
MPSAAFIKAASAANRQPVVLLAIESVDAIKKECTTKQNWLDSSLTNINATTTNGEVCLQTDGTEDTFSTAWPEPKIDITPMSTGTAYYAGSAVPDGYPANFNWGRSETAIIPTGSGVHTSGVTIWFTDELGPNGTVRYTLIGRINGGAWQILKTTGKTTYSATGGVMSVSDLARGLWEFTFAFDVLWLTTKYSSLPYFKVIAFKLTHETRYMPTGSVTTIPIDLGLIPTLSSRIEVDDIIPPFCTIAYSAWGRNAPAESWLPLGPVSDGGSLAAHQYYQIKADLAASADGHSTPSITEIRIIGGNSQYKYFSTHKDTPMQGALPYIVPGGISSISSKIDLAQQATVGELTARIYWLKQVGDMIADDWIKNKTIICKFGFIGLSEIDYVPYFVGSWYDYQADNDKGIITVKTRNILKRFNKKVPEIELFRFPDGSARPSADSPVYSGNVMQVMLKVADALGIPDRLLNRTSFTDLASGARSGSDWLVSRKFSEPCDAMELLNELSVSSGVFLFEGPDGRLTAKLYDSFAAATSTITLDAMHCKFRPVDGGQKDLSTRQAIYYNLISGKDGGSSTDYLNLLLDTNATAEEAWEESNTREWFDKWDISDVAVQLLATRWASWFSTPRPTVRVDDVPPRYYSIERGAVVAVDNLQLPCPVGEWQGYTNGTKFLVMGKSISDPTGGNLTVSFDLMMIDDNIDFSTNPDFPHYSRLDYWPGVRDLTVVERIDTSGPLPQSYVDISFSDPLNYFVGTAVVWYKINDGDWIVYATVPFANAAAVVKRLTLSVAPGTTVEVCVTTLRPDNQQTPLDQAPTGTVTVTTPAPDPSHLLAILNSDITTDRLAQYLNGSIGFTELVETGNDFVVPGFVQGGAIANLPQTMRAISRQSIDLATGSEQQFSQLTLLANSARLRTVSGGRVAGLAIGFDDSGDTSEIVFEADVIKFFIDNAALPLITTVDGIVGINGGLTVHGDVSADRLISGERIIIDGSADNISSILGVTNSAATGACIQAIQSDRTNASPAIYARSGQKLVQTLSGIAPIVGVSYNGYAASFQGNQGAIVLKPGPDTAAPDWTAAVGALWVTSDGILYICKGGTTWQKVADQ